MTEPTHGPKAQRLTLYADARDVRKLKKVLKREDRSLSQWFRAQVRMYLGNTFHSR